ncbi:MAG TPA: sodium/glucose cotransporter [Bacteroidales bacterium]|nr:sodium/glucose cotransporter [Bacteroidales bacterium]
MNTNFSFLDYLVFGIYALSIVGIGLYVSRKKKGVEKTSEDYFLAGKSLPWWAVGASLIAANISAEQMIGMSGSGFAIGLAIASYEWMAAITLLIVGKYFLPVFIKQGIYTIPEFLEKRYGKTLKSILAVFWISLFVLVNLTTVLYLGALALDTILGSGDGSLVIVAIVGLGLFTAIYSLWGGLSAVAWTDVLQVFLLVLGGLITAFIALDHLAPDGGAWEGLKYLYEKVPEKFSMILEKGELIMPDGRDAWWDLPSLSVLIGGMWIANLYYWGFNQYIIQRTFAAKSLKEAQKGIVFAAGLKLIIPLIVVIPGIIAFVLNTDAAGMLTTDSVDPSFLKDSGAIDSDKAYPWLVNRFVPVGLKGLILAALAAAIVSSLASMLNSTATIFTMDIYKPYVNKLASEKRLVNVGRITGLVALIVAGIIAPMLGNLPQAFQYIQEYTGIVSPGILAIFMLGLFWRKTTNKAAVWGAISAVPVALFFKAGSKAWFSHTSLENFFPNLPWMDQMAYTFILVSLIIAVVSLVDGKGKMNPKGIQLTTKIFKTERSFDIGAIIIIAIVTFLYLFFW